MRVKMTISIDSDSRKKLEALCKKTRRDYSAEIELLIDEEAEREGIDENEPGGDELKQE